MKVKVEMKPIPGYPGYYATSDGEIITTRTSTPKTLSKRIHKGYFHVNVRTGIGRKYKKVEPVHKLVLLAFKGVKPTDDHVTRHLDGNPFNNSPSNLEWGTVSENVRDSIRHGTATCLRVGEEHPRAKLSEQDVVEIKEELTKGAKQEELARRFGVTQRHISSIKHKRVWKHLP